MKHILFVCALAQELQVVKSEMKKLSFTHIKVSYLLLWVGNYHSIYHLKNFIDSSAENIDFIVNIWVCGIKSKLPSQDVFQVYRIIHSLTHKESICPIYISVFPFQSLLSSEVVICDEVSMYQESYVDMESFGVDYVATKEKIPYVIIKKPFDIVWIQSKQVNIKDLKNALLKIDFSLIIEKIQIFFKKNSISNIPWEDLWFYKDFFWFTFAEFQIFKKYYNKFRAFDRDFKKFFEDNKGLWKKEFLEKMQNKK